MAEVGAVAESSVEPVNLPSLNELFERRRAALGTVRASEVAIRGLLRSCSESGRRVTVSGYPSTVGMPRMSDTGQVISYAEIACEPLIGGEEPELRVIEGGTIHHVAEDVFSSYVAVQPANAQNYWVYPFNRLLEIEIVGEEGAESLSPEA